MDSEASSEIKRVVIVGGGSAGWITAGLLAAEHGQASGGGMEVTLVESPDVRTIGVGEGTWPTMRATLARIGIDEAEFLRSCTAAFKQGTRFVGWVDGGDDDVYYHPFTVPEGYPKLDLAEYWRAGEGGAFADAVTAQVEVCERNLAPKQPATPPYAGVVNYGYHLDAGKFAELLVRHCTQKLGVRHVLDHVTDIEGEAEDDIRAVRTKQHGAIAGDLFIDCTGFAALLIGRHYGMGWRNRSSVLFNDSALAQQVPHVSADAPIASQTISVARSNGWIWDIGLTRRRGLGYTYSSRHIDDDAAEAEFRDYALATSGLAEQDFAPRRIRFEPGFRETFWHRNCVAVGMAAGFIEPLEASALVMVELAGRALAQDMPADRDEMRIAAARFNELFDYRWARIIDFLKLHYVLSRRDDTQYWRDHRDESGIPESLKELLLLWRHRVPAPRDFARVDEVFSAASYQYVLYGMGFGLRALPRASHAAGASVAARQFADVRSRARTLLAGLPDHRELLEQLTAGGTSRPDAA